MFELPTTLNAFVERGGREEGGISFLLRKIRTYSLIFDDLFKFYIKNHNNSKDFTPYGSLFLSARGPKKIISIRQIFTKGLLCIGKKIYSKHATTSCGCQRTLLMLSGKNI